MIPAARAVGSGAILLALAGAGLLGARLTDGRGGSAADKRPARASAAAFDSATLSLHGMLTSAARVELTRLTRAGAVVVVLLDTADIRVCEDLGRQIRELRTRADPAPLIVAADTAAMVFVRAFARREHLRPAGFAALIPGNLLVDGVRVPTPAALVVHTGSADVVGSSHPRRFANVRVRSFADELSPYLPATVGSDPPPDSRRSR